MAARSPARSSTGPLVAVMPTPSSAGQDVGQGGLAQAGVAVQQDVVQGLAPLAGRGDEHLQVGLGLGLADVLVQGGRA